MRPMSSLSMSGNKGDAGEYQTGPWRVSQQSTTTMVPNITPIMENQMEKKMENEMETRIIGSDF